MASSSRPRSSSSIFHSGPISHPSHPRAKSIPKDNRPMSPRSPSPSASPPSDQSECYESRRFVAAAPIYTRSGHVRVKDLRKTPRRKATDAQLAVLEPAYLHSNTIAAFSARDREELCRLSGLTATQLRNWWQNRRRAETRVKSASEPPEEYKENRGPPNQQEYASGASFPPTVGRPSQRPGASTSFPPSPSSSGLNGACTSTFGGTSNLSIGIGSQENVKPPKTVRLPIFNFPLSTANTATCVDSPRPGSSLGFFPFIPTFPIYNNNDADAAQRHTHQHTFGEPSSPTRSHISVSPPPADGMMDRDSDQRSYVHYVNTAQQPDLYFHSSFSPVAEHFSSVGVDRHEDGDDPAAFQSLDTTYGGYTFNRGEGGYGVHV